MHGSDHRKSTYISSHSRLLTKHLRFEKYSDHDRAQVHIYTLAPHHEAFATDDAQPLRVKLCRIDDCCYASRLMRFTRPRLNELRVYAQLVWLFIIAQSTARVWLLRFHYHGSPFFQLSMHVYREWRQMRKRASKGLNGVKGDSLKSIGRIYAESEHRRDWNVLTSTRW